MIPIIISNIRIGDESCRSSDFSCVSIGKTTGLIDVAVKKIVIALNPIYII